MVKVNKKATEAMNKELTKGTFTCKFFLVESITGFKNSAYKSRNHASRVVDQFISEKLESKNIELAYDKKSYDIL